MQDVAGLVLTGGSSRRFGVDKATLLLGGEALAARAARVLGAVTEPVVEVGPGHTGARAVREDPPGSGPLAAVGAGWTAVEATRSSVRGALVLAVDLPFADVDLLGWLVRHPAPGSVVPVVDGRPQPLCARYSASDLDTARELVARGTRSMRALLDTIEAHEAHDDEWHAVADPQAFADVDSRDDAAALGVEMPR